MEQKQLYNDISQRTGGDIYIGIVGPVRTGKSTFIKGFMDSLVVPNIKNEYAKQRAIDELPQSSAGRTIMTTEPKFIPENGVEIFIEENVRMNVRLIDCVGYIVPSSIGYIENNAPRMVATPWYSEEIPFNMAAEIGTSKVINDHCTIGLVITTDGSITDIPRAEYAEAEERVINELIGIDKPFIILVNSTDPEGERCQEIIAEIEEKYGAKVLAIDCLALSEDDIKQIMASILYEFPINEMQIDMPSWISTLSPDNEIKNSIYKAVYDAALSVHKIGEVSEHIELIDECEFVKHTHLENIDLGAGNAKVGVEIHPHLFYNALSELSGMDIKSEADLIKNLTSLASMKREYDKIKHALDEVNATGYGIVMPSMDEMSLEEPQMVRQGGKYGVKLRASAPSIHMMRVDTTTEVSPIVGTEKQSEELVMYLLSEFEGDKSKLWESNIFGKSLHELVAEGMHNKLNRLPADAREKLSETLERIINDGCNGLICIIV